MVEGLRPYELDRSTAACNVSLVDPVSFLADQPIWGAYRSMSAGEMIGGALSLAAGGDGKPSLSPVLPQLPPVWIVEGYRDDLKTVPYAIATGQALGDWLAEFLATLGLRAELSGLESGTLILALLDSVPRRRPFMMNVVSLHGEEEPGETADEAEPGETVDEAMSDGVGPASGAHGPILIRAHSGFPGAPWRGGLLDDPTTGSAARSSRPARSGRC